jgi:hypothetical protein
MDWKILLAYITGTVDQELLLRNEYLVTENRMLRNQIKGRVRRLTRSSRRWWCAWRERIAPGATTGSLEPWPTSGTPSMTGAFPFFRLGCQQSNR